MTNNIPYARKSVENVVSLSRYLNSAFPVLKLGKGEGGVNQQHRYQHNRKSTP